MCIRDSTRTLRLDRGRKGPHARCPHGSFAPVPRVLVGTIAAAVPAQRARVGATSSQAAIPRHAEGIPRGKQKQTDRHVHNHYDDNDGVGQ
eukprot:6296735-Alexandrium_andersonii.AAC.1